MTRTSVWVKIPKLCHNTPLSIFFSWEREGILTSQNLTYKLSTSALSALPPAQKRLGQSVDDAHQNCPKYVYFSHKFCAFPVTEGNEI